MIIDNQLVYTILVFCHIVIEFTTMYVNKAIVGVIAWMSNYTLLKPMHVLSYLSYVFG